MDISAFKGRPVNEFCLEIPGAGSVLEYFINCFSNVILTRVIKFKNYLL